MDIKQLFNGAKELLARRSVSEFPSYPGILPWAWLHPDFFWRLPGSEELNGFAFQPVMVGGSGFSKPDGAVTSLVWFRKPFCSSWMQKILEFLGDISPEKDGVPSPSCDFQGLVTGPTILGETGSVWGLSLRGCRVGEVRVISGLGGDRLPSASGVAVLDLDLLASILNGDFGPESVKWDESSPQKEVLSWRMSGSWSPRPDGKAVFSPERWERWRAEIESSLGAKRFFEAFRICLGTMAWFHDLESKDPLFPTYKTGWGNAFRPLLKNLIQLFPKTSPGPASASTKTSKEAVLR